VLIGSAHNNKEIKIKEKQGVKIIVLSSLFKKIKIIWVSINLNSCQNYQNVKL
jgi:hypothetical protein